MTKRFQYNVHKNTIEENGKFVAYMNSIDGVRIANKLNILQKENEQLKERNEHLEKQLKCITQSLQSELNYHGFMSSLR